MTERAEFEIIALPEKEPVIDGPPRFVRKIRQGLRLLKRRYPECHHLVITHVDFIRHGKEGCVYPERPREVFLDDRSVFWSRTSCAGAIAHEAFHAWQFQNQGAANVWVQDDHLGILEVERECLAFEAQVLKRIGASFLEIDYVQSLDGRHALGYPPLPWSPWDGIWRRLRDWAFPWKAPHK